MCCYFFYRKIPRLLGSVKFKKEQQSRSSVKVEEVEHAMPHRNSYMYAVGIFLTSTIVHFIMPFPKNPVTVDLRQIYAISELYAIFLRSTVPVDLPVLHQSFSF